MPDLWNPVLNFVKGNPGDDKAVIAFLSNLRKLTEKRILTNYAAFGPDPVSNYVSQIKYNTYREFVSESFGPESICFLISKAEEIANS